MGHRSAITLSLCKSQNDDICINIILFLHSLNTILF